MSKKRILSILLALICAVTMTIGTFGSVSSVYAASNPPKVTPTYIGYGWYTGKTIGVQMYWFCKETKNVKFDVQLKVGNKTYTHTTSKQEWAKKGLKYVHGRKVKFRVRSIKNGKKSSWSSWKKPTGDVGMYPGS